MVIVARSIPIESKNLFVCNKSGIEDHYSVLFGDKSEYIELDKLKIGASELCINAQTVAVKLYLL